jgi:chromosome segregation ATPase
MSREQVITLMTLVLTVGGAIFSFSHMILPAAQAEIREEIVAHIDKKIDALRDDIRNLPTANDVENASLRAKLYALETTKEQEAQVTARIERLESSVRQLNDKSQKLETEVPTATP